MRRQFLQWSNTTVRRALSDLVFGKIRGAENLEETTEMLIRYTKEWRDQVTLDVSAHYHMLGCHFLQSAVGLVLAFRSGGRRWEFGSGIEYKVEPMKVEELPCRCMWFKDSCISVKSSPIARARKSCPFFSVKPRRLDLCWIERTLLDNIAITAEVETRKAIKRDLAKVHSIFVKSASRGARGFINPIVHVQLELSGRDSSEKIASFMKSHWAEFALSPFIIYITEKDEFKTWIFRLFHRGELLESDIIDAPVFA